MKSRLLIAFILGLLCSTSQGQRPIFQEVEILSDLSPMYIGQNPTGMIHLIEAQRYLHYDGIDLHEIAIDGVLGAYSALLSTSTHVLLGTTEGELITFDAEQDLDSILKFEVGISKLFDAHHNEVLVLLDDGTHQLIDLETFSLRTITGPQEFARSNDLIALENRRYLATDIGLWTCALDWSDWRPLSATKSHIITDLHLDEDGTNLWIGSYDGKLWQLHEEDLTLIKELQSPIVQLATSGARLFTLTKEALIVCDRTDMEASLFMAELPESRSRGFYFDDEWNIWWMQKDGVQKASLYFSEWLRTPDEEVRAVAFANGNVYFGTEKGLRVKGSEHESLVFEGNISCIDSQGSLMAVGSFNDGLRVGDPRTPSSFRPVLGLLDQTVLALRIIDEQNLVVSTLAGTQLITSRGGEFAVQEAIPGLERFYVLSIYHHRDGSIYFGTDKRGFLIYQHGQLKEVQKMDSLSLSTVHSICPMADTAVMISSSELGLLQYDGNQLSSLSSPHLTWDEYSSILQAESESFLLVGEKEVALYFPSTSELIAFDEEIGLKGGKAFNNDYAAVPNGQLIEHAGKFYLYHKAPPKIRHRPVTRITDIEAGLRSIPREKNRLSEEEHDLRFSFSGILYRHPDKLSFQYRLDGFDESWRSTKDRAVSYPRLDPGKYTFYVRSAHDLSFDQADEQEYSFEIVQAFYKRPWFIGLISLSMILALLWFWQRRNQNRRLKDRLALLQSQSQMMGLKAQLNPHFLFNSFNTIIGLTEEDPERSVEFTEHLTDFYRMVIQVTEEELIALETEMKLLDTYLHLLSIRFGQAIHVLKVGEFKDSLIPPLSLQLLIENAVKHNKALEEEPLEIEIKETQNHIRVSNSKNIRQAHGASLGVGLTNLRSRYRLLAKKAIIVDEDEEHFTVILPKITTDEHRN